MLSMYPSADSHIRQYDALLAASRSLQACCTFPELIQCVSEHLPDVLLCDLLFLILCDTLTNRMVLRAWTGDSNFSDPPDWQFPLEKSVAAQVFETRQPISFGDVETSPPSLKVKPLLLQQGLKSVCALPLQVRKRNLGILVLGSKRPDAFTLTDLAYLQLLSSLAATAVAELLGHPPAPRDQDIPSSTQTLPPASGGRWHRVLENSTIGVALTDMTGRFTATNAAYQKMLGYTEEEFSKLTFLEITEEQFRKENWAHVEELIEGKRTEFQIEKQYRRKDGSLIWVKNSVSLVPGTDTMPTFIMALAENVTERKRFEHQLQRERDRLQVLLDLNNMLVSRLDLRHLFQAISSGLRRCMEFDHANLKLLDADSGLLRIHHLDHPESHGLLRENMLVPIEGSASGWAFRTKQPVVINSIEEARHDPEIFGTPDGEKSFQALKLEEIRSACNLPLFREDRVIGILTLASRRERAFVEEDVNFLSQIAGQIVIAVENALSYGQIAESRDRLAEEKHYLAEEIRTEHNFEEIIGESAVLKRILKQVETVAPTDSSVLILGETGTGKELIARAIHKLSSRREQTFIKLNCAAIPLALLESELFGHEKGAFTGAISQKIGRFELAHRGTLFLDEIGDIPLELQPKLLRILQEQEFERLGSTRTIRVDARVVAATSRDLPQMIEEQRFRSDLYYRVNVFPIRVAPLRERPEDISILARHFTDKFARRMNKRILEIPDEVMQALTHHSWPGNIRELQNFVERAVILSPGNVLRAPLSELRRSSPEPRESPVTLEEAEREHILKVLQECNWVLSGSHGAASRLGLKRTTLSYKMQQLGITNPRK